MRIKLSNITHSPLAPLDQQQTISKTRKILDVHHVFVNSLSQGILRDHDTILIFFIPKLSDRSRKENKITVVEPSSIPPTLSSDIKKMFPSI